MAQSAYCGLVEARPGLSMPAKALESLHSKFDVQLNVLLLGPAAQLVKPGWVHKVVYGHTGLQAILLLHADI